MVQAASHKFSVLIAGRAASQFAFEKRAGRRDRTTHHATSPTNTAQTSGLRTETHDKQTLVQTVNAVLHPGPELE
jgi:hypothetical protein